MYIPSYGTPSIILIVAAVVPAVFLMYRVWKEDKLEAEPRALLWSLVLMGILSTFIAIILESVGQNILGSIFAQDTIIYQAILYFIIVGPSEEIAKYVLLKRRTWRNPEFNCKFDGVVYAVFVSLGFALFENIEYVFMYGLATALVRAVTAIPGHATFGVFMGLYYGEAKRFANAGNEKMAAHNRKMAVIVPAFIHGVYDFIATVGYDVVFLAFIAALFIAANKRLKAAAASDYYI